MSSFLSHLPLPDFDNGGKEEVRGSVKIIQTYNQSQLSEKLNCFLLVVQENLNQGQDWSKGDQGR